MKNLLRVFKQPGLLKRGTLFAGVAVLLFWLVPQMNFAQINSQDHYIFITGQLNNNVNGAPVTDHQIYIEADSSDNNGFIYSAVIQTDVNGFYYDTIITQENTGMLRIYLYDFDNNLKQAEEYYRFLWSNEFHIYANFEIFDPNANEDFQANFVAEPDTFYQDPMRINFHDLSIGYVIKSWHWDFGDGQTSEMQDTWHVYSDPGNYLVTLSITSRKPENEYYDTSRITKQVQVGLASQYILGGQVFASYFPIDHGMAYLYTYDTSQQLVLIDTSPFDSLGYYWFHELPEGQYFTKARLQSNSTMYGQFMPTYYGHTIIWNNSNPIDLEENEFGADINLIPSYGINSGGGQIIGQISYDTSLIYTGLIPAGDIEILLLSDHSNCLTCGLSDIQGNFLFGDLAYGTYQIYPDVTGVPTTPMFITISEDQPIANNVTLVISKEEITFSIKEGPSQYLDGINFIYPNPVKDQARMKLQVKKATQVNLTVTDMMGRIVDHSSYSLDAGEQQITLDASQLAKGTYSVNIYDPTGTCFSSKFIKIR